MSDITQIGFDYAALPVESALTARAAAERIKLRLKRTVEDIIEIGRELTEVKAGLPHGQFLPWIAAEFEMSDQSARQFMWVYDRFGGENQKVFEFRPSVLYALAAPSTPESVIEKAIEKAESGEKVTVSEVKTWKAEYEEEKRRSEEWRDQYIKERDEKREAQQQIELLKSAEPEKPKDYEEAKQQAAKLTKDLA